MNASAALHPTEETLCAYAVGKLDDQRAESVDVHLETCPPCRQRIAELTSDSFVGRLRRAQAKPGSSIPAVSSLAGLSMLGVDANSAVPPPASTLPPGLADHADYEIKRELGRGGMGVVYLAHNKLMGRDEVLKVVGKHLTQREGVLERFSREVRSAARLDHPNIVRAYSAFRSADTLILAMEFVVGLDLAGIVKAKGPLPVANACNYVYQTALGLQHAHEQGMVHRDVKPGNLILSRKGERASVKVLDFGLAKATREAPVDGALTHEGQMLGTPDFIAPEQIRDAQSADIRADIYSLGCTLFYLLSGTPPFTGLTLYDILQAHFSMHAKPLNLTRPDVPVELAALVAKMMAKDPERRFQTPGDVARALLPFFKKTAAHASPEMSRSGVAAVAPDIQPAPAAGEGASVASGKPLQPSIVVNDPAGMSESTGSGDLPVPTPAMESARRPPWRNGRILASAGALGAVLLGVIVIVVTKPGRVTIDTGKGETKVTVSASDGDQTAPPPATRGTNAQRDDKPVNLPPAPSPANPENRVEAILPKTSPTTAPATAATPEKAPAENPREEVLRQAPAPQGIFQVYTNSIGMKFVLINEGNFKMGSPDGDELAPADQKPQHPVRISRPFYLGVFEVTQAQYQAIIGDNPSVFSATGGGRDKVAKQATRDFPVEYVSWIDAITFCNTLSEKEGLKPFYELGVGTASVPDWAGPGYRLPTEAEWEYACRAGSQSAYSFGNNQAILNEHGWYRNNSDGQTHRVGLKKPNAFGLFDMHGNVREWCWDLHGPYANEGTLIDPHGPSGIGNKVVRGGSWGLTREFARSAAREQRPVGKRHPALGFRVAVNRSDKIRAVPVSTTDLLVPRRTEPDADRAESKPADPKEPAGLASAPIAKMAAPVLVPGSPEYKLASRGLTQLGSFFVVASETSALEKLQAMRPLIAQVRQAFFYCAQAVQAEMLLAEAEQMRIQTDAQIEELNKGLGNMPNGRRANNIQNLAFQAAVAHRDGLAKQRDGYASRVEALRGQQVPAERKVALGKEFASRWTEFLKEEAALLRLVDKARDEYHTLRDDKDVKDLLETVRSSTKKPARLGPSKQLQTALDAIKKLKRECSPGAPGTKKTGPASKR